MIKKITAAVKINFPYMTGVLCLICGIAAYTDLDYAGYCEKKYLPMLKKSTAWPHVKGKIISHAIYEKQTGRFSHSPRTHYYAEPSYSYTVGNKKFEGRRICFLPSNCNTGTARSDAQNLLDGYPANSTVTVYYNPAHPSACTLIRGNSSSIKSMEDKISGLRKSGYIFIALTLLSAFITYKTAREFRK